jgi:arginyl-tRNA synthetase
MGEARVVATMNSNLFDYFDDATAGDGSQAHWALRAPYRPQGRFDLMLVPRVEGWREDRESLRAVERIEAEPWIEAVERRDGQVWLRLTDGWVERHGAALEERDGADEEHGDLTAGERFALNFWDANSTKALHIGHLRNLSLGNALGGALAQAGGQVERRSIICDVGRSMGEAMAGVVRSGRYPQMTAENGVKSDHFVGYCYADYVKTGGSLSGLGSDHPADSLTRELDVHNDSADELLHRVLGGDQAALELWSQTRAWVISGQRKTLARLGISFDRVFFESDFLPEVVELTELGLQEGTLERRADGAIVYLTGREELEEMPLVRSDGVPTQHMRALAYWLAAPGLDDVTSVQVCGQEWVAHVTCRRQLMAELVHTDPEENGFHPLHDVFHGMVAKEQQAVASSKKDALLIDHLIEWLDEQVEADPGKAAVRDAHPSPGGIAAQVALGFFPLHPNNKKVDFEPQMLLRDGKSLGWDMARARAKGAAEAGGRNGDRVEDPDYRFAVVQGEMYRRNLRLTVERLDPLPLARFASHLSRWRLQRELGPHADRVVSEVLDDSARGLGLEGAR